MHHLNFLWGKQRYQEELCQYFLLAWHSSSVTERPWQPLASLQGQRWRTISLCPCIYSRPGESITILIKGLKLDSHTLWVSPLDSHGTREWHALTIPKGIPTSFPIYCSGLFCRSVYHSFPPCSPKSPIIWSKQNLACMPRNSLISSASAISDCSS